MGYAVYRLGKGARYGGYGVPTYCEHPDCNEEIDRGMSFACGGEPYSEGGCDRYFCSKHLAHACWLDGQPSEEEDEEGNEIVVDGCAQLCEKCREGKGEVFDYKPEHPEWVWHLLNHYSWEDWRQHNKDTVAELLTLPSRMPEGWTNDPDEDK